MGPVIGTRNSLAFLIVFNSRSRGLYVMGLPTKTTSPTVSVGLNDSVEEENRSRIVSYFRENSGDHLLKIIPDQNWPRRFGCYLSVAHSTLPMGGFTGKGSDCFFGLLEGGLPQFTWIDALSRGFWLRLEIFCRTHFTNLGKRCWLSGVLLYSACAPLWFNFRMLPKDC